MPNFQNEPAKSQDGYVNPATGGDGGDRPAPKVTQNPKVDGGYVMPSQNDQGARKAKAEGGSKSKDGYDNMGIDTDGPGGMGKPGSKYPGGIKKTGTGGGNQWDS